MKWTIEFDPDPDNDGFPLGWTIMEGDGDDDKVFRCVKEADAQWLCDFLNANDA